MGLAETNFLRRNCILVELKLFYDTLYPPKELYWNHRITTELSKFSDIKYARPTFAIGKGTFKKTSPKLDLILATPDIHKLATVLFNLRAFIMNKREEKLTVTMCQHGSGVPSNEGEDKDLDQKYSSLLNVWGGNARVQDSPFTQLQPDTNLLFARRPVDYANTTENRRVDLSSRDFFRLHEEQHERNEDDRAADYSQSPAEIRKSEYGPNMIHLEPLLYHSYSSLPTNMKLWLNGVKDDKKTLMEIDENATDKLDMLLHGFKGFPQAHGNKR
ncbi:hypothetical protein SEUBUCD646_0P03980 [Saccharomyces eubayanus]|uniref:Mitochondrial splicing system relatd protein n=2 Tax=Saccharomyces TaxID=4930 RepID=A0A6C1EIV9_SACPS|nr:MSS18-like protein [Saccharomyces eubayanus]KOG96420.1 MSS18-like protein [Saccharomyces eubayanus]QID88540.1 mitochondrial splicing system relatd protein [Saccharomyces pastorianus]CAI1781976.1 hypothetical protein SEUBUCD650_0P03990 [Saccharomyces eubayanus]CAI1819011.1 hypothetical protein SEUBUCD646_0P03980 [Saccharomyces eubayanus]